jgi:hypothetical protein
MSLASTLLAASFVILVADPALQPRCRDRCDSTYASDLAACDDQESAGAERRVVDECRDAAESRHQECIDQCND